MSTLKIELDLDAVEVAQTLPELLRALAEYWEAVGLPREPAWRIKDFTGDVVGHAVLEP